MGGNRGNDNGEYGIRTSPSRNNTHSTLLQNPVHLPRCLRRAIMIIRGGRESEIRQYVSEGVILNGLQIADVQDLCLHARPVVLLDVGLHDVEDRGGEVGALDARVGVRGLDDARDEAAAAGVVEDVRGRGYRGRELGDELLGDDAGAAGGHALVGVAVGVVEGGGDGGGGGGVCGGGHGEGKGGSLGDRGDARGEVV